MTARTVAMHSAALKMSGLAACGSRNSGSSLGPTASSSTITGKVDQKHGAPPKELEEHPADQGARPPLRLGSWQSKLRLGTWVAADKETWSEAETGSTGRAWLRPGRESRGPR